MSYEEALTAAGANVLEYEAFGSYQGDWWALVEFGGRKGWVNGSYGSCSGCDAFEAEFGYGDEKCDEHRYSYRDDAHACIDCDSAKAAYKAKLSDFGREYLGGMMTTEEAIARASRNLEWDMDAREMVEFVKRARP